jgi:diguanylate cyclase (GGDEF)-like protein
MTGQTLLLNPDGHRLMGAPEDKLWGFMFDRSDTFAAEYRDAWTAITNNDNGTYMSDEGIFVFRKAFLLNHENLGTPENLPSINQNLTAHFDDHFWILVSHISNSMIDELASKRAIVSSGAYITLFLVTSLISYLFARNSVQKKLAYRQLEERAIKDDLTGAANRRELNRVGKREFLRATRFGHPLSMLMLDLDHFKQVNDSFGHDIGDLVLKHVTGICQSTIREQDLLSRFGGEEFVILMPETDIEGAKQLADRLCTNVRTYPYLHRTKEISLTVSIGISSCIDGDPDYRHILVRADKALYQAKINGRDRVEVLT